MLYVLMSYAFWQSRYGGDGAVVGKKISLDAHPFEIIGVIQPGFEHGSRYRCCKGIEADISIASTGI